MNAPPCTSKISAEIMFKFYYPPYALFDETQTEKLCGRLTTLFDRRKATRMRIDYNRKMRAKKP
ncbi:hypothetical protein COV15_00060 [Candidatus Woesearchaeota archaeon CG10_big_fil_rev_8_21_14_0_10_34_12]|nr:MAG: hypothetical protein COV15_00060 [Candidatus Woesearchaeota archaeon CG10_big_fil_rev_8_21_14_0_10_34_12]